MSVSFPAVPGLATPGAATPGDPGSAQVTSSEIVFSIGDARWAWGIGSAASGGQGAP